MQNCDLFLLLMPGTKPGSVSIEKLKLKCLADAGARMAPDGNVYVKNMLYMRMENGCFVPVQRGQRCTTLIMTVAVIDKCAIFQTSTGSNYIINLEHDGAGLFKFTDTVRGQIGEQIRVCRSVFSPTLPHNEDTCAEFFLKPKLLLDAQDLTLDLYS